MLVLEIDGEILEIVLEPEVGAVAGPALLSRTRLQEEGPVLLDLPVPLGLDVGEILPVIDGLELVVIGQDAGPGDEGGSEGKQN